MSAIQWTDDGSANFVSWLVRRIATLLPSSQSKAKKAQAGSDAPLVYSIFFQAPLKSRSDFRKAAELMLLQLMPVQLDELVIYGRRNAEGVELAALRKADMESWSKASRTRRPGAAIRLSESWAVLSPESERIASRRRLSLLIAAAFSAGAVVTFHHVYLSSLDGQLAGLLSEEQRVRSSALAFAHQREEANLWSSLEKSRAVRRLPAAILSTTAEISRVMPAGAAWTHIEWSSARVVIAGTAADPVAVLAALSTIKASKASFSKPMTNPGGGKQEFEIVVTYGEAA